MGLDVLLVERNGAGSGASQSNGGWVTPSKAVPLPAPGVVRRAVRSILRSDGLFGVGLRTLLTTDLLPWLTGFLPDCSRRLLPRGDSKALGKSGEQSGVPAPGVGLEPTTNGLTVRCSAKLSYPGSRCVRRMGWEPEDGITGAPRSSVWPTCQNARP